jgi:hypothetical protein
MKNVSTQVQQEADILLRTMQNAAYEKNKLSYLKLIDYTQQKNRNAVLICSGAKCEYYLSYYQLVVDNLTTLGFNTKIIEDSEDYYSGQKSYAVIVYV